MKANYANPIGEKKLGIHKNIVFEKKSCRKDEDAKNRENQNRRQRRLAWKFERPEVESLDDEASRSKHDLVWSAESRGWRCNHCKSFGARASPTVRLWLQSYFTPTLIGDARGPVRIPPEHPHLVGRNVPHASHLLYFYRGVT